MKQRFEPNEQRREDFRAFTAVISAASDGKRMSYVEIEQASGVRMDQRGKGIFRSAAKRSNRPYLTIPGLGVEFSSADNAIEIARDKLVRVRHSVSRFQKTASILADKHLDEMRPADKSALILMQSQKATLDLVRMLKA
jgi:hypothetical protein